MTSGNQSHQKTKKPRERSKRFAGRCNEAYNPGALKMVRTRVEDCERYVAKKRLVLVRNRLLHRLASSLKGRGATIALVSRGWKSGHLFWRWKQTHRAGWK